MKLNFIEPIIPFLPEVKNPDRPLSLNEKIFWTLLVLILFFTMYHIVPFAGELKGGTFLEFIQTVLASKTGTLLTIGIGPIILASIFLQLFAGAKIIEFDPHDPADKRRFSATQKVLAIVLSIVEAALFVIPGVYVGPDPNFPSASLAIGLIIAQIAFTSILLIFLDEVVSRYGIGSGISLFIAAGVSLAVVQGSISLIFGGHGIDPAQTVIGRLAVGGSGAIPSALIALLPIIFMFVIIVLSVYAEGVKVEIPLTFRGFGTRFPVKLLYVSVLPVILTSALLMNIQLLSRALLYNHSFMIGETDIIPYIGLVDANGQLRDGILYMISPITNPLYVGSYEGYIATISGSTPLFGIPEIVHILIYFIVYVTLCVIFGRFWMEASNMSASAVAEQITQTGLSIPGFRSDPRIIEQLLDKYITTIAILGSMFVGFLAVLADLTGAIGTGTGILLTVGIISKFYEDFKQQNLLEMYPGITKFLKG
ncbi:MAG: preprotein translocase subunit SecY [Candidatus Micrarchaeia archaeon]